MALFKNCENKLKISSFFCELRKNFAKYAIIYKKLDKLKEKFAKINSARFKLTIFASPGAQTETNIFFSLTKTLSLNSMSLVGFQASKIMVDIL